VIRDIYEGLKTLQKWHLHVLNYMHFIKTESTTYLHIAHPIGIDKEPITSPISHANTSFTP